MVEIDEKTNEFLIEINKLVHANPDLFAVAAGGNKLEFAFYKLRHLVGTEFQNIKTNVEKINSLVSNNREIFGDIPAESNLEQAFILLRNYCERRTDGIFEFIEKLQKLVQDNQEFFDATVAGDDKLEKVLAYLTKQIERSATRSLPVVEKEKTYRINEIFYSIQGEGVRAGTANVFVRFAGCNLKCRRDDELSGFDCDTEFTSGKDMTLAEIYDEVSRIGKGCRNIIFTGGEPLLQIDERFIKYFSDRDDRFPAERFFLAVETNGTRQFPEGVAFDWICCSPKSAEHTLQLQWCDELKYVRNETQGIPKPTIKAENFLISPAFESDGSVKPETLRHCVALVEANPTWRLSVQFHKFLGVR